MPIYTIEKYYPVCVHCQQDNVIVDAIMRWDKVKNGWFMVGDYNGGFTKCINEDCNRWEQDVAVDWILFNEGDE